MANTANPTASAVAHNGDGNSWAQITAITAAIKWPPTNGQGWAIGLCGTANSKKVDAPIEANTSKLAAADRLNQSSRLIKPAMAKKAPLAAAHFSDNEA